MTEDEMVEAAKLRDRAAAAAQGDTSAWAHLLDVMAVPDARMRALEVVVQRLAAIDEPYCYEGDAGENMSCGLCGGSEDYKLPIMADRPAYHEAHHDTLCPWVLARTLYPPK